MATEVKSDVFWQHATSVMKLDALAAYRALSKYYSKDGKGNAWKVVHASQRARQYDRGDGNFQSEVVFVLVGHDTKAERVVNLMVDGRLCCKQETYNDVMLNKTILSELAQKFQCWFDKGI